MKAVINKEDIDKLINNSLENQNYKSYELILKLAATPISTKKLIIKDIVPKSFKQFDKKLCIPLLKRNLYLNSAETSRSSTTIQNMNVRNYMHSPIIEPASNE